MDQFLNLPQLLRYLLVPPPARSRVVSEAFGRKSSSHAGACGLAKHLGNSRSYIKFLPCLSTMISHEQKIQKKQEQMKMAKGTRSMNM